MAVVLEVEVTTPLDENKSNVSNLRHISLSCKLCYVSFSLLILSFIYFQALKQIQQAQNHMEIYKSKERLGSVKRQEEFERSDELVRNPQGNHFNLIGFSLLCFFHVFCLLLMIHVSSGEGPGYLKPKQKGLKHAENMFFLYFLRYLECRACFSDFECLLKGGDLRLNDHTNSLCSLGNSQNDSIRSKSTLEPEPHEGSHTPEIDDKEAYCSYSREVNHHIKDCLYFELRQAFEREKIDSLKKQLGCSVNSPHPLHFLRFCERCQIFQPLRSKHCRECDLCVPTFDHHCFWIGCCVGELNHRVFVGLLLNVTVLIIIDISVLWNSASNQKLFRFGSWMSENGVVLLLICLMFLCFVFVFSLLCYHCFLVLSSLTTWEHMSSKKISYLYSDNLQIIFDKFEVVKKLFQCKYLKRNASMVGKRELSLADVSSPSRIAKHKKERTTLLAPFSRGPLRNFIEFWRRSGRKTFRTIDADLLLPSSPDHGDLSQESKSFRCSQYQLLPLTQEVDTPVGQKECLYSSLSCCNRRRRLSKTSIQVWTTQCSSEIEGKSEGLGLWENDYWSCC